MTLDDDVNHDPTTLDSAMDTGSDVGEPGDRPDDGPLTGDERDLLDQLTHDHRPDVVTDAPEDSPAAAQAAVDDTVLPGIEPTPGADPDEPAFRAPGVRE
jgi:hypothetical protein